MTQQINLYDPALRRRRELLSLANVAIAGLVLIVLVGIWGAAVRHRLEAARVEEAALAAKVKNLQEQVAALGRQASEKKPDARLAQELEIAQTKLAARNEILALLKKGLGPEATSFAEYLRGLARQTPRGLWLTGFAVAGDGAAIEIHGRTLDPALVPEYIGRLNGEKAFQGKSFSALQLNVPGAGDTPPGVATPAGSAAKPAGETAPPYHEFTLAPSAPGAAADAPMSGKLAQLTTFIPDDAGTAFANATNAGGGR